MKKNINSCVNLIKKNLIVAVLMLCSSPVMYADARSDFDKYQREGVEYYNSGQYSLAAASFDKAIKSLMVILSTFTITDTDAFINLIFHTYQSRMRSSFLAKDYDRAFNDADFLSDVIDQHKYNDYVYNGYIYRGRVHMEKKDYRKAIEDITEAINRNPEKIDGYYYRSYSYSATGEFDKARTDNNYILETDPSNERAKNLASFIDKSEDASAIGLINEGDLGENYVLTGKIYDFYHDGEKTDLNVPVYIYESDDNDELTIELFSGSIVNGQMSISLDGSPSNLRPVSSFYDVNNHDISDIDANLTFLTPSIPAQYGQINFYSKDVYKSSFESHAYVVLVYADKDVIIKSKEVVAKNINNVFLHYNINLNLKKGWNYCIEATSSMYRDSENDFKIDWYTGRPDSRFKWYFVGY
jgi:Tfp pilus assembly protein PilF